MCRQTQKIRTENKHALLFDLSGICKSDIHVVVFSISFSIFGGAFVIVHYNVYTLM